MAAAIVGITGDVVLPTGFNILVKRGTLQISTMPIDTTNTSTSAGNQEVVGGIRKARGSCVGIPQTVNAPGFGTFTTGNTVQLPAAMTYKVNGTTCKYTFNGLITNISHGFDYAGAATLSFDYESSGAITEVWA